ncbi:hypothetical protein F5888DRAFT_117249 [Russula emetica]|nr:hypothetical protein F5888DRAFT_117249 [Russula emetica]
MSSRKKHSPSDSAPANTLVSQSQANQQQQFAIKSQSQSQQKQQSQPVCRWSAHASPFGQSPSPCLRHGHTLSTSATAAGELFLFGGLDHSSRSPSNDLYVISTRDFSTTLLTDQRRRSRPTLRTLCRAHQHHSILLIWGGVTNFRDQISMQNLGP